MRYQLLSKALYNNSLHLLIIENFHSIFSNTLIAIHIKNYFSITFNRKQFQVETLLTKLGLLSSIYDLAISAFSIFSI